MKSAFVVVVADADDAGNVVLVFLLIGQESVVIVVAEVHILLVLDRDVVAVALRLIVGILERAVRRGYVRG